MCRVLLHAAVLLFVRLSDRIDSRIGSIALHVSIVLSFLLVWSCQTSFAFALVGHMCCVAVVELRARV